MLFYTKWVLLGVVAATVSCGVWVDKSTPYFPIEISRTATGPVALRVFQIGVSLCTGVLWFESETSTPIWPWLGLLLLAWVDDVTSWSIHMLGVAIMALGTARMVFWYQPHEHIAIVMCCGVLWFARLLMKWIAVVALEHKQLLWDHRTWHTFTRVTQDMKRIMYNGDATHPLTIYVFRITGVMQWLVFLLMSTVY